MEVNKSELEKIIGISQRTFTTLQSEENFPIKRKATKRGQANIYETKDVIQFLIDREVGKLVEKYEGTKTTLEQENIRYTAVRTEKVQIELDLLKEAVMPADEVKQVWADQVQRFKTKLINLPSKLAAWVIGKKDYAEIEQFIRAEVYTALDELACDPQYATEVDQPGDEPGVEGNAPTPKAAKTTKRKPVGRQKPKAKQRSKR